MKEESKKIKDMKAIIERSRTGKMICFIMSVFLFSFLFVLVVENKEMTVALNYILAISLLVLFIGFYLNELQKKFETVIYVSERFKEIEEKIDLLLEEKERS